MGVGLRDRMVCFLCFRLATLSAGRIRLREAICHLISRFSHGGQISIHLRWKKLENEVFLRCGNVADYLVFGEMVGGSYSLPKNLFFEPTAIIDGGANIGLFTIFAASQFPGVPITCYEPEPDNVGQLCRNLRANNLKASVVQKALWLREGRLFFHPHMSYSGHVSEAPSDYTIDCVALDVPDGAWLKLDIEGAEYEVLPQVLAAGSSPALITMEIHDYNRRGQTLIQQLTSAGYRVLTPVNDKEVCANIHAVREGSCIQT